MTGRILGDAERIAWLRLTRTDTVGPRTFQGLINRFGEPAAALAALPDLLRRGRASRVLQLCSQADAEREMDRATKRGIRFVALCEPAYPAALRAIDAPPPMIAVQGIDATLLRPTVAVVGSRNASASGLIFTERLVRPVAAGGYAIASGLARGIDAKAHVASLDTGTIAVLAGGHERIYPSEHEGLARRILDNGAVISEMPLGWEPRARDFPRRNRLVAGLSHGVVVVEASRRSGSLITARFANEQGREVFAVPGSPLDPRAEGTNDLLRQGATICTSGEDVLNALRDATKGVSRAVLRETGAAAPAAEPFWDEEDLFGEEADKAGPWSAPAGDRGDDDGIAGVGLGGGGFAGDGSGGEVRDARRGPDAPTPAARLLALIGPTPIPVDELVRASGLAPRHLQAALVELELSGRVCRLDGHRVAAVPAGSRRAPP